MPKEIFWTPLAKNSFIEISNNLVNTWGNEVLEQFEELTNNRISQLLTNPQLAPQIHKSGLRKLVIHKNISIFYDIQTKYIRILLMWDNRMNPTNLKNKLKIK